MDAILLMASMILRTLTTSSKLSNMPLLVSSLYECSAAFRQLNFSPDDVHWVYATCAGILHLSNVDFKADGEGSKIDPSTTNALQSAARLLKVLNTALFALHAHCLVIGGCLSIVICVMHSNN